MKSPELTGDQVFYLRGLVRMSIRKRRRELARFAPKPGQDPAEAREVLAGWQADLKFREGAYIALGGDLETMTEKGREPGIAAGPGTINSLRNQLMHVDKSQPLEVEWRHKAKEEAGKMSQELIQEIIWLRNELDKRDGIPVFTCTEDEVPAVMEQRAREVSGVVIRTTDTGREWTLMGKRGWQLTYAVPGSAS